MLQKLMIVSSFVVKATLITIGKELKVRDKAYIPEKDDKRSDKGTLTKQAYPTKLIPVVQ